MLTMKDLLKEAEDPGEVKPGMKAEIQVIIKMKQK